MLILFDPSRGRTRADASSLGRVLPMLCGGDGQEIDELTDSSVYLQKVFDIIHPPRRNLTAIRGYVRLGGYDDDPRTDPQDRSWFGPHDRLFVPEESEELEFRPGPEFGKSNSA